LGLGVPKVTEVLFALRERGYDLKTGLFDIQYAKEEILAVLRSKGLC
jgi:energy-coupling factor transport system ATP-binding protein